MNRLCIRGIGGSLILRRWFVWTLIWTRCCCLRPVEGLHGLLWSGVARVEEVGNHDRQVLLDALQYAVANPDEAASLLHPSNPEDLHTALQAAAKAMHGTLGAVTATSALQLDAGIGHEAHGAAEPQASSKATAEGKEAAETDTKSANQQISDMAAYFGIDVRAIRMDMFRVWLTVSAVMFAIVFISFELVHRRWADVDLDKPLDINKEVTETQLVRLFKGVTKLVWPYFSQRKCRKPWMYAGMQLFLGFCDLVIGLIFMVWLGEFWDSIQNKHPDRFETLMRDFCVIVFSWVLVGTYASYVGMMLAIHWREFMTNWLLDRWLQQKAFYRLQLEPSGNGVPDNPDQRIQEDVEMFVTTVLSLAGGLLDAVANLVVFTPILFILSPNYAFGQDHLYCPGWLLYISIVYSGVGTLAAHCIGQHLIIVNFAKQKYEATFRYQIVQIRDNAESIALYGSEAVEHKYLQVMFEDIIRTWWNLMKYSKRLGFFIAFYMQTSVTFPYLVLTPSYFKGQITLGSMFMLFRALGTVKGSFDWLISSYQTATTLRATVDRLENFVTAIEERHAVGAVTRELPESGKADPPLAVSAQNVSVWLPGKANESKPLWRNAGLQVKCGEFVLLSAPEGSGKSCFFRALAGIWPHAEGKAMLPDGTLFVPQRSYIPQGTLKQAVTYPESAEHFTDDDVHTVLKTVGLAAVVGSDLNRSANWCLTLSGGEQQRLAVAHVLLRQPPVVFLDEATSAMGEEGTLEVYNLLRKQGTLPVGAAVISISHDLAALKKVHDIHYAYDPVKGTWQKQ